MTILPHPHASPLPSWASRPNIPTARQPSFPAALRSIIGWLTGRQPQPSKSELQFEQRVVDLLAEEMAGETSLTVDADDGGETSLKPRIMPKRPRRLTGREDR